MRKAWKIFRAIVSALLLLVVALPAAIYVLLSLHPVQGTVRDTAMVELSSLLGAEVTIDRVSFHPFNTLSLRGINLCLDGDTVVSIKTVSAGFRLFHLLSKQELVFDYALLDGVDVNVWRDNASSPLNIAPVIARLKSDGPKEKRSFSLEVSTLAIRRGRLTYDVLSVPEPDSARFSLSHVSVSELALNAYVPHISDGNYVVSVDHFSLKERSGFVLERLGGSIEFTEKSCTVSDLEVQMPGSRLAFEPLKLEYDEPAKIVDALRREALVVETKPGCSAYPPDLQAFVPALKTIKEQFTCDLSLRASLDDIDVKTLRISDAGDSFMKVEAAGHVDKPFSSEEMTYDLPSLRIGFDGTGIAQLLKSVLPERSLMKISQLGVVACDLSAKGSLERGSASLKVDGSAGRIDGACSYFRYRNVCKVSGKADVRELDLGGLTGQADLGLASVSLKGNAVLGGKLQSGQLEASIDRFDFRGYPYTGGHLAFDMRSSKEGEIDIKLDDPSADVHAYANYDGRDATPSLMSTVSLVDVDMYKLGFLKDKEGYKLGARINIDITDANISSLRGRVDVNDFYWLDRKYEGLRLDYLTVTADPRAATPAIFVESPVLEGRLTGHYNFETLPVVMRDMALHFIPVLSEQIPVGQYAPENLGDNDFAFDFELHPWPGMHGFFRMPFSIADGAQLNGRVDAAAGTAYVNFDAPYVRAGDRIVESTSFFANLNIPANTSQIYATTQFGTKKGDMSVATEVNVADNVVTAHVDWEIERLKRLNGTIDLQGHLLEMKPKPGDFFPFAASIDILPGTVNFGDETWRIARSKIHMSYNDLAVFKFGLDTGSQSLSVHGTVSPDENDEASIVLDNVSLLPIFETLDIDKALIGGRATGTFSASRILTSEPQLECHHLHVDSIGYNRCPIGNADIYANWNNDLKAFYLDADVKGFEDKGSRIHGYIYPAREALDINFEADSIPVGFLSPFMSAFARDISGRASGKCRLFGTFKEIDLEGDIFADNVRLAVDFTNTSYIATDSVHMRPGKILLEDIRIKDEDGHTASLTGEVRHKFFKEPVFNFKITDARDFLSYNVTSRQNPDWYGTIYGNGGAEISGKPGEVNIDVDMSTAPRSTFTFVLSDRLDAEDYSFLTFRDVTPDSLRVVEEHVDDTPEFVRAMRRQIDAGTQETPSRYKMDINVDVNPDAEVILITDPASRDKIEARGSGHMELIYESANNNLDIIGKYVVSNGSYHFALQDVIHKDFTIKEGSEIKFDGDPYAVKTDLTASYSTRANLSDLDESFLEDSEVVRNDVLVNAILKVTGDIRQPSLDFDLEFPDLSSDTYRKVRSIVSTPEMMNRQIIYLLALNRFYTPDYMSSTTKGNELFSVVSSTLSSQIGNMLGKLSDNWSIAPNLRSDRGDFSDVEVDVALTSHLLNNRLIFNGNFGYRDKTLNSNQFIGDFDIEYLLNKRGNWRLKAYNRYNDRNFYFRSAQTTQGIGIMYRRDFDRLFNFLQKKRN